MTRNKSRWKFFYKVFFISITLFLIINLPFFEVTNVYVEGSNRVSNENILKYANATDYKGNIFYYAANKYENVLERNPYIESAEIKKIYPNVIDINIEEREVVAYIEYLENSYLYIDKDGRVLEVKENFTESLPVVVGVKIDGYSIGSILNVEDENVLKTTLKLSELFRRYGVNKEIVKVDLSDTENIMIYVDNMYVYFGNISDADEKTKRVTASYREMKAHGLTNYKGFYHIEDIKEQSYFELLK